MKKLATLLLAGAIAGSTALALAHSQEQQEPASERAAQPGAGEHGELEGWKWANFVVLAAGLGYLAVKHGGPFFAARSLQIRKELTEAELVRKEAQERADAVSRRIANLESEIAAMREQSKTEADAEADRVRQHTAAEIAKIRAHVEAEIAAAGKAARTELKRYSAHLAVTLAEQKVRARMNEQSQEALVRGFVQRLNDAGARRQAN